jgi:flavin-binding protein dodecin
MCRSRSNAGSAPLPFLLGLILCTESASSLAPDPRVIGSMTTFVTLPIWEMACASRSRSFWMLKESRLPPSTTDWRRVILLRFAPAISKDAAKNAVERTSQSLRDLRVAEVVKLDMALDNGKVTCRAKVNVSFKYEGGS